MEIQRYRLQLASGNGVLYRCSSTGPSSPDFTEFRFSRSIREASYNTRGEFKLLRKQVLDVLEQQGRAAGLPDFVVTTILSQLGMNVLYTPLPCPVVSVNSPVPVMRDVATMTTCVISGNTVTTICLGMGAPGVPARAQVNCALDMPMDFTPIPPQHLSILRTLTTSNAIMATWSRVMWQSVVNRVLRTITSGTFGTQFATAAATVT
ncbi:hypothetical protein KIN20_014268 [Parelaphostrongylus tenuis]|uniref:Uncharacterized protein n=1 Tax=Parelaphostrongylus tenuis TaxID=148309 RepID=A0AAD5MDD0_PARTN|nr:hypothetical protein KIN20_014268 [Parelaphostrongylus tenuis]